MTLALAMGMQRSGACHVLQCHVLQRSGACHVLQRHPLHILRLLLVLVLVVHHGGCEVIPRIQARVRQIRATPVSYVSIGEVDHIHIRDSRDIQDSRAQKDTLDSSGHDSTNLRDTNDSSGHAFPSWRKGSRALLSSPFSPSTPPSRGRTVHPPPLTEPYSYPPNLSSVSLPSPPFIGGWALTVQRVWMALFLASCIPFLLSSIWTLMAEMEKKRVWPDPQMAMKVVNGRMACCTIITKFWYMALDSLLGRFFAVGFQAYAVLSAMVTHVLEIIHFESVCQDPASSNGKNSVYDDHDAEIDRVEALNQAQIQYCNQLDNILQAALLSVMAFGVLTYFVSAIPMYDLFSVRVTASEETWAYKYGLHKLSWATGPLYTLFCYSTFLLLLPVRCVALILYSHLKGDRNDDFRNFDDLVLYFSLWPSVPYWFCSLSRGRVSVASFCCVIAPVLLKTMIWMWRRGSIFTRSLVGIPKDETYCGVYFFFPSTIQVSASYSENGQQWIPNPRQVDLGGACLWYASITTLGAVLVALIGAVFVCHYDYILKTADTAI